VPQAVLDALTHMGLPGLVILAMGWWIDRQDKRIVALQGLVNTLQDKRVEDAQKMAGEALELSDALKGQTALLNEIKGGMK
jgi:hypothetical protein